MIQVKTTYGSLFSRLAGCKGETINLETPTLDGLVRTITGKHSKAFGEAVSDPKTGELLPGTAVLVNGKHVSGDVDLNDGDEVTFIIAFAGG